MKLLPKSLKLTRPTLAPHIPTPEKFAQYAKWVMDVSREAKVKASLPALQLPQKESTG